METAETQIQNEREVVTMIPLQSWMEQVQEKRSEKDETDWENRMGGEEAGDLDFFMEEDVKVELDSGFCMEVNSELSLAGQVSDEELDWFVITDLSKEQREGRISPGEDGGRRTQDKDETEDDSESMKNVDTEAERGAEMDDEEGKEKETQDALQVCLQPVEESGAHVRICVEEVERYYKFSRSCYWLCGRCHKFD